MILDTNTRQKLDAVLLSGGSITRNLSLAVSNIDAYHALRDVLPLKHVRGRWVTPRIPALRKASIHWYRGEYPRHKIIPQNLFLSSIVMYHWYIIAGQCVRPEADIIYLPVGRFNEDYLKRLVSKIRRHRIHPTIECNGKRLLIPARFHEQFFALIGPCKTGGKEHLWMNCRHYTQDTALIQRRSKRRQVTEQRCMNDTTLDKIPLVDQSTVIRNRLRSRFGLPLLPLPSESV